MVICSIDSLPVCSSRASSSVAHLSVLVTPSSQRGVAGLLNAASKAFEERKPLIDTDCWRSAASTWAAEPYAALRVTVVGSPIRRSRGMLVLL